MNCIICNNPTYKYHSKYCKSCINKKLNNNVEVKSITKEIEHYQYIEFIDNRWKQHISSIFQFKQFLHKDPYSSISKKSIDEVKRLLKYLDNKDIYDVGNILIETTIQANILYLIYKKLFYSYYKQKLQSRFNFSIISMDTVSLYNNHETDNAINSLFVGVLGLDYSLNTNQQEYFYKWLSKRTSLGLPSFIFILSEKTMKNSLGDTLSKYLFTSLSGRYKI